ncbi:MAG: AAA family ATPase, partial [Planctomycetales bacterium]
MELESVPAEIDSLQRRLMQLELASRQLSDETDDQSQRRLEEIHAEMDTEKAKLAELRAQWEAEKQGAGDVGDLRRRLDQAEREFEQLQLDVQQRQSAGESGIEQEFQRLYQLDQERKELAERLESAGTQPETATKARLLRQVVDEDVIAEVVSAWTGVPVRRMLETEKAKLLQLEDRLHVRMVGQDEAVSAVADAVRRSRAGLQDPNRPIGSFLFLGPTGVGKTELCKTLAETLFDDENAMVRLDMTEFMERHTVSRLIGAPPGYVGYEEGGRLTEAVRRRPYSVVLLDEIEKAHPDVFNVLLQLLDDGRLTDNLGHTVDFTNTIVVMTSNIAGAHIQEIASQGGGEEEMREAVQESLKQHFLPEFLNRIDESIVFHPLTEAEVGRIALLQIERLRDLLKSKELGLEVTETAVAKISELGYDPNFGARPLKRVIQQQIQNPLATELLRGGFSEDDLVKIDYREDAFTFERLAPVEATG